MPRIRSKTLATWLAVTAGTFGAHRFYLKGRTDPWAWLHGLPTAVGLWGLWRARQWGQDDHLAWVLLPFLGLSISAAMLAAIVYGLTSDERWATRQGEAAAQVPTGWGPVLGVILALMLGATALMSTVAFVGQRTFEWLASGR